MSLQHQQPSTVMMLPFNTVLKSILFKQMYLNSQWSKVIYCAFHVSNNMFVKWIWQIQLWPLILIPTPQQHQQLLLWLPVGFLKKDYIILQQLLMDFFYLKIFTSCSFLDSTSVTATSINTTTSARPTSECSGIMIQNEKRTSSNQPSPYSWIQLHNPPITAIILQNVIFKSSPWTATLLWWRGWSTRMIPRF